MVKFVRFDEAKSREGIRFVSKTFVFLFWELTFLILKLQVLCDSPVMVTLVRYCYELVGVLLRERVPGTVRDWNGDHRLCKNVFVAVDEIPHSESRDHVFVSLFGT